MKKFRKLAWAILAILILFLLFGIWYKNTYSMQKAEAFEVNIGTMKSSLLIATQGSDFKNIVTQGIVDYYRSDSVFIKVIDVAALNEIVPKDYDAILILHTWEYEKPPAEVGTFINSTKNTEDNIVVFTTSGPGTSTIEGIDAITGESDMQDAAVSVEKIIARLNPLLEIEN